MYFVDSIGNLTTEAAAAAMEKTGVAGDVAGFDDARKAQTLSKQFKTWAYKYCFRHPAILISINHLHVKIEGQQGGANFKPTAYGTPGGVLKDYMATTQIRLAKESVTTVKTEERSKVRMTTLKCALGPTGRDIIVIVRSNNCVNQRYPEGDILSENETADRVQRNMTFFDWDTALFELVTREDKEATWPKASMQAILQLANNNTSSKRLGVKELKPNEMGAAIHANLEVCMELQDLLGITRERAFAPHGIKSVQPPPAPAAGGHTGAEEGTGIS
jgi:hypothetical protein